MALKMGCASRKLLEYKTPESNKSEKDMLAVSFSSFVKQEKMVSLDKIG